MVLAASDRVAPRVGRRRIAGVERRDGGEVVGVIAGERADPAELADIDCETG
jgi:hypothetical protein